MDKSKKKKLIILSVLFIMILAIGGVYAWLTFTTGNIIVAGNTHCFNINYTKGNDIIGNIGAIKEEDYLTGNTIKLSTLMGFSPVSIELDKRCNKVSGIGTIELNVNSLSNAYTSNGNSYGSLKYVVAEYDPTLYEDSTIKYLKNNEFTYIRRGIISEEGTMDIHTEYLSPGDKHNYIVIIYLDKDKTGDDIIGANISATVSARADQFVATPISDFTYVTDSYNSIALPSNTVLLTKYNGTDTVVNVPSTYVINDTTYNVMVIGDSTNNTSTFSGNTTITEVNFADGVLFNSYDGTSLVDNSANSLFKGCTSLVNAPKLSDAITNMDNTYNGCTSLTNAQYVPSSVTSMNGTFKDCTNLEGYIRISNENVVVDTNTFSGTTKAIVVEAPANSSTYNNIDTIKPNNVELVPLGKLDLSTPYTDFIYILGSDQTEITALSGPGVNGQTMETVQLDNTTLNGTITIESDEILLVRYIGEDTSVTVPETYRVNGNTYRTKLLSLAVDSSGNNGIGAFINNTNIEEVYLNENIGVVGMNINTGEYETGMMTSAFAMCTSLTTIPVIPKNVTGTNGMFGGCNSLNGTIRFYLCEKDGLGLVDKSGIFENEYTDNQIVLEFPENSFAAENIDGINSDFTENMPNFSASIFESDYCPVS